MGSPARGEEDDLPYLELFNGSGVEVFSADRSPRPASQTAENITVVTSKDIAALNAHTLADVLFTVTGIQLEHLRTPGSPTFIQIQGAIFNHVLVLIDNVPINNLNDNYPDIASVPVQMIERVEIVKGAASSSWGNALGGVINVITKMPLTDRPANGLVSGSIGEHATSDVRGEVTGTVNRLGYYLAAGNLHSGGLHPNNDVDLSSVYGKVTYDLLSKGSLAFTASYTENSGGIVRAEREMQGLTVVRDFDQDNLRRVILTLSSQHPLTDRLHLDLSARTRFLSGDNIRVTRVPALNLTENLVTTDDEEDYGASIKLSWFNDLQRIAAGVDYDYVKAHLRMPLMETDLLNNSENRVGIYVTDTLTLGSFALTPSARFDHTQVGGDLFSPSFGVTYALSDNTVLRGYTARGYSLTSLNRSDTAEKVWTSQLGFETADVPFLWLKGTAFRNDTWDINVHVGEDVVKQRQLKRGFEIEARTLPVFDTSLSAGYTYIDARDGDTDAVLEGVPRHTLHVGMKYEDSRHLRVLLSGQYFDWNLPPGAGKYDDIIWDLYLAKKVEVSEYGSIELFASVRNLLNGDMYMDPYVNPRRWAELGVRCTF